MTAGPAPGASAWRWPAHVALMLGAVAIVSGTLLPASGPPAATPWWCVLCGERGLADAIANVLLFVPLGIGLWWYRIGVARLAGGALAASLVIELLQWQVVSGRDAGAADVAWNTLGALLGAVLAAAIQDNRRAGARTLVASVAAVTAVTVAGMLTSPSFPASVYYGQWTAQLGHFARYHGAVLSAGVEGLPLPSTRLADSRVVRERLAAGAAVTVRAVAGPPPDALAPIFSIFDDAQREILVLGTSREDLVLRVRTRAADLGLAGPEVRWRGALAGVRTGDTLALAVHRDGRAYCLGFNGRRRCGFSPTAGRAWSLIQRPAYVPAALESSLDMIVMALLGTMVGATLCRQSGGFVMGVVALAVAIAVDWAFAGQPPLADAAGLVLGMALGTRVPPRW
jgi:hypothetical protein